MLSPMLSRGVAACVILAAAGCGSRPTFVQIAPGVAVSLKSIDEYAEQKGLSREEAKRQLAAEVTSSGDAGAAALAEGSATSAERAGSAQ
jgi:hypothetical protein